MGNFTGFGTPASDRLIEAIAQEEDDARKAVLLRRFQRLLRDEAPLTVLFFTRNLVMASARLAAVPASVVRPGYEATAIRIKSGGAPRQ